MDQMLIIYTVLVTNLIFLYCFDCFPNIIVDMFVGIPTRVAHGVATSERNAILGIFLTLKCRL